MQALAPITSCLENLRSAVVKDSSPLDNNRCCPKDGTVPAGAMKAYLLAEGIQAISARTV